MATHTAIYKFNSNNTITVEQDLPEVNKGDTINFEMINNSGKAMTNWGLYFNNPFELDSEHNYAFGMSGNEPNIGTKVIQHDGGGKTVPKYSSYLVYVESNGQIYTLDPQVIVNDGDINN